MERWIASLPKEAQKSAIDRAPSLLRVERCRHSVEAFGRTYFPELMADKTPDWHFELDRMVEELYQPDPEKRGAVIAAPRGHGKTARISQLHTLHSLLYGRDKFIVLISSTDERAEETVRPLKSALETNELLRKDFGNLVGSDYYPQQAWNSTNLILTWPSGETKVGARSERPKVGRTAALVARGVQSKLRGLRHNSWRPTAVVLDDAEAEEDVASPTSREAILHWLYAEVSPMLDPRLGKMIVVGTILHFDSLLSKLLKRSDVYHTKIYRAIQENNTPLWPEHFSLERLEQKRLEVGSRLFSQEYLNNPLAEGTRVFKPEWFRPYTADEVEYDEHMRCWKWRGEPLRVFQGVDPAISDRQRADDFARVTIGVTEKLDIIVLDVTHGHFDFPTQVKMVEDGYLEWVPDRIGVEEVGFQRALRQQIWSERALPIKPMNNGGTGKKSLRITALDTHFEAGHVYIRKATNDEVGGFDFSGTLPWKIHHNVLPLFQQLVEYPDSAHDDMADALEMAFNVAGVVRFARAERGPIKAPPTPDRVSRSRSQVFSLS